MSEITKDKQVVQIAIFAALLAALGFIPPIPFATGVPISAQSLGVMLAGTILGARNGALSMILFLVVVALGANLLAGGRGGLGVFAGPTAGFLFAFPFSAFAAGLLTRSLSGKFSLTIAAGIGAFVGGILVMYLFGIAGFKLMTGRTWLESLMIMWVYIPGDTVKVVLAALVTGAVARALPGTFANK